MQTPERFRNYILTRILLYHICFRMETTPVSVPLDSRFRFRLASRIYSGSPPPPLKNGCRNPTALSRVYPFTRGPEPHPPLSFPWWAEFRFRFHPVSAVVEVSTVFAQRSHNSSRLLILDPGKKNKTKPPPTVVRLPAIPNLIRLYYR